MAVEATKNNLNLRNAQSALGVLKKKHVIHGLSRLDMQQGFKRHKHSAMNVHSPNAVVAHKTLHLLIVLEPHHRRKACG